MRLLLTAVVCVLNFPSAFAASTDSVEGVYVNPSYDRGHGEVAWIEIKKDDSGRLELTFNIPCESKTSPRKFRLNSIHRSSGSLELLGDGAGMCHTGNEPRVFIYKGHLRLTTNPKIKVPGFDGFYELTKQQ